MGQYHYVVNLTKREFINPHRLGCGLKVWEQMATHPGTAAALIGLLCYHERRGGGDITGQAVGRWFGDRIALIGDYAEDSDASDFPDPLSKIYDLCRSPDEVFMDGDKEDIGRLYTDISDIAREMLESQLGGKFTNTRGFAEWRYDSGDEAPRGMRPDMVFTLAK
jgi:hypothetical protein